MQPAVDETDEHKEEDDLNTSSTNLDIHQQRTELDQGESDHQVLYARLKHPIARPSPSNFPDHVRDSSSICFLLKSFISPRTTTKF